MVSARDFDDGHAYQSGPAFAAVDSEHAGVELELIEGELPASLRGVFARNSSNPRFTAPDPYHWFDGDGMVHAVSIAEGRARYSNRWVRTPGFAEDERAGEATWTGLLSRPDMRRPGGPYKNTANTDLLWWQGRLLALWWMGGGLPYALTLPELDTQGAFEMAGTMTAHAKVDPRSGELVFLDYQNRPPFLTHGVLTPDGQLTRTPIELAGPRPQHDLALTERYTILSEVSMFPDPAALARGKVHMRFFPEVPTRLGLFDRRTHTLVRWFEVPACYIYHFANAWESESESESESKAGEPSGASRPKDDKIVVTACVVRDPLMYDPQPGRSDRVVPRIAHLRLEPKLVRWTLDLRTGLAREELVDEAVAEFPRVDDRKLGAPTQAAYLGRFAAREQLMFEAVRRVDLKRGAALERVYGPGLFGGEVSVVPLSSEGDETLISSFVTDEGSGASELWLMSSDALETVARLRIPARIPAGFHARWISGAELDQTPGQGRAR